MKDFECACGCGGITLTKYLPGHYIKGKFGPQANSWKGGRRLRKGYWIILMPDHPRSSYGYVFEHILIAEKLIGKPINNGIEIHHYGDKSDNTKIVICQDSSYHNFLHKRTRAYKECGHASWLKCAYCGQYDDPKNMHVSTRTRNGKIWSLIGDHKKCKADYDKKRWLKKKVNKVKLELELLDLLED